MNDSTKRARGAQVGNVNGQKHGFSVLKRAVNGLGNRVIDRRTATGKALAKWRTDLLTDLGGETEISTQQSALIDLCVRSKLLLDSIDTWLLVQPSLVNSRKKSLLPVVRERQQLADGLAKYLAMLGLRRIAKELDRAPWERDETGRETAPAAHSTALDGEREQ
jgi:hypothetical protein